MAPRIQLLARRRSRGRGAPSDARLYGPDFEDFPELSAEPYFVQYVAELAEQTGFGTVNLLTRLRPFAETEMLYYRDDHHWNERGNQVVAQLIQAALDSQHRDAVNREGAKHRE